MTGVAGNKFPRFFEYYGSSLKLVETPDGGVAGWRLSEDSGGWERANHLIDKALSAGGEQEIYEISPDEFIWLTEQERGRHLDGDGPVFALYKTVEALQDTIRAERRYPTPREQALITGIRRRTFVMFEEQLRAAGDPGADPSIAAP